MAEFAPRVDLMVDGVWTSLPDADVQGGVSITRGRQDRRSRLAPSRASVRLAGSRYSPHNPGSDLYGKVGQNTPARVAVPLLADAFARTSASGWGTADTGQTWVSDGGDAADYTVAGGVGAIAVDTVNSARQVYADVGQVNAAITATIGLGQVAVNDDIQVSVMARRIDADNHYLAAALFAADGTVSVVIGKRVAGVVTALDGTIGIPYTAASQMAVELAVDGQMLAARLWDVADPTSTVSVTTSDDELTAPGGVGVRAVLGPSLSNSLPVTVSVSLVQVDDVRITGEVASWAPEQRSVSDDVVAVAEIAGISRRLGTRGSHARSAQWRAISRTTPHVWWPLEVGDGRETQESPSGLAGGGPLKAGPASAGSHRLSGVVGGVTAGPPGAAGAVDVSGGGQLSSWVTTTDAIIARFELSFLFGQPVEATDSGQIFRLRRTFGNLVGLFATTVAGSELTLELSDEDGTFVSVSTGVIVDDGAWHHARLDLTSLAVSTEYELAIDGEVVLSGTATNVAWEPIDQIVLSPTGDLGAVAHAVLWLDNDIPADSTGYTAHTGHAGETAGDRMVRVCAEDGVACALIGDADLTALIGPQPTAPLLDILIDCEQVDQGLLFEPRPLLGFAYRTRASLYNQPAALPLDYSQGHLAAPLSPTDDDAQTANDVTVSSPAGGSARYQITSGPKSVQDPPSGIGTYDGGGLTANVADDEQLPDLAAWLAHLGSQEGYRYPQLTTRLHAPEYTSDAGLAARAVAVDCGGLITVDGLPSWLPPDTVSVLSVGQVEDLDGPTRTIRHNATQAELWMPGVLEGDADVRADTAGSDLAAQYVAGTDTSMLVFTTTGPRWITTADHGGMFPLDVRCGGARIEVTGIEPAETDSFTRTESSGWGTSESGFVWSRSGGSATDYSVASGTARHSLGTVNTSRRSFGGSFTDVEVRVKVRVPVVAATDSIDLAIMLRHTDANNYYHCVLHCHNDSTVDVRLRKVVGGSFTTMVISHLVDGYTAGSEFWLQARVHGDTFHGKAWAVGNDEPPGWHAEVTDTDLTSGGVGLRSNLQVNNTNTLPQVIQYDDFSVLSPQLFTVEQTTVNSVTKTIPAGEAVRLWTPWRAAL